MTSTNPTGLINHLLHVEHSAGNASDGNLVHNGWFVGNFLPNELGLRSTGDVEIKWGVHEPGEGQDEWTVNKTATTVSILVRGKDTIIFPDGDVLLEQEGDYAIWAPGVPHKWRAVEHSVVISVRWPSSAHDAIEVTEDEVSSFRSSLLK